MLNDCPRLEASESGRYFTTQMKTTGRVALTLKMLVLYEHQSDNSNAQVIRELSFV